jgi:hypothetical protein
MEKLLGCARNAHHDRIRSVSLVRVLVPCNSARLDVAKLPDRLGSMPEIMTCRIGKTNFHRSADYPHPEVDVASGSPSFYMKAARPFGWADVLRAGCDSPPAVFASKGASARERSLREKGGQQTRLNSEADGIVRMEENT